MLTLFKSTWLAALTVKPIVVDAAWVRSRLGSPTLHLIDGRAAVFYDGNRCLGGGRIARPGAATANTLAPGAAAQTGASSSTVQRDVLREGDARRTVTASGRRIRPPAGTGHTTPRAGGS